MCHPCKTLLLQYWSLWHCVCHVDHILNEVHINYVKLYDRETEMNAYLNPDFNKST